MSELLKNIDARTRLAGTNKLEILLFTLGVDARTGRRETFGINVFKVREVMRTPQITAAPEMPDAVKGMVSLRGALVPVVDLGRYGGISDDSPREIMIVTEYNGHTQGFLVEAVDTILRLDWSQMRVPPEMLTARLGGLVTAVTELADGRLVMLLDDYVRFGPAPQIGMDAGGRVWRARKAGEPVALIIEGAASDGYAGRIGLVVAVHRNGRLSGVRVTEHKETPGLGDYIDPRKDRRKDTPWIAQFTGATWAEVDTAAWTVRKDGGSFDYRAGATISARAVTRAAGRSAAFAAQRMDALFAAPAGGLLGDTQ